MALRVAHACILGGLTTPSHTGTCRNVGLFHLAMGVHSVAPSCRGESSRSLASPVRRVSAASGSCHGLFLGALFCQKMVESCVRASGFAPDTLPMDRHGAPAMTRDSICFGVYVDGVCAVGCDRRKVLAAMKSVKTTLDAAGLQCSEIEADISRQVFTGLRLDHESGILSLEDSRNWRLRHDREFAASQKQLTGVQGG